MTIFVSSFTPEKGTREYYFAAAPDEGASFTEQLSSVFGLYKTSLDESGLGLESGIYINIYISDSRSQEDTVRDSSWVKDLHENGIAVSVMELPPLFSNIAILAYHIAPEGNIQKKPLSFKDGGSHTGISVTNSLHTLYFLKGLTCNDFPSVSLQTSKVFDILSSFCDDLGIPYKNILRTWLYLRDIDRDYGDMVLTRSRIFSDWCIHKNGRFPASTGIGGRNKDIGSSLLVDAVIIDGVLDEQLQKMEAISHMSPAMDYGVTFERGVKVRYGDREHLYISGTASIDAKGDVMHHNDILGQTERTVENIGALLDESSSSISELAYLIVYLKNPAHADIIEGCLKENLPPHIPHLLLHANICRPEWLIEIEGMAIRKGAHSLYENF